MSDETDQERPGRPVTGLDTAAAESCTLPASVAPATAAPAAAPPSAQGAESQISYGKFQNGLLGLSEAELARLNELADMLQGAKGKGQKEKVQIAASLGCSPSTVDRKIRALEKYGLAGLLRKNRIDRGRARVADAKVIARIKTQFLQNYRPSAASIYKEVARDYEMSGLRPPSYSFVLRKTKEIDPDLIAQARVGAREFDDKYAVVTLRKKPALPRLWCDADHHLIDHVVIFSDGSIGRPWLTAIQDICTNEITGYLLSREKKSSYPGAAAIGLCLRNAILRKDLTTKDTKGTKEENAWPSFGLFENFYSDLGKDFRSQYVRAVCHDLGIKTVFARGYHGKSKPIERWFGTLEASLKHLPGYVGRSPETNPEKQVIGAPRAWEDLRGEIMTIDQFAAALHNWIVNVFHHTESPALRGYSPIGLLEKHVKAGWTAREVANERALDLLMMSRAGKTVQRFGIQLFSSGHTQRFFMAPELTGLVGQEVQVFWDPARVGEIVIYKDNRFVCKAENRELLDFGADEEDLKAERDLKRKQKESVRARFEELQKQAQYPEPLARAQAEKRLEKVEIEEREKIAVNARAQSVTTLLPKFAQAAKQLKIENGKLKTVGRSDRGPARRETLDAGPDDLKSSENLFAAEEYDRDDDLKSSEELFGGEE